MRGVTRTGGYKIPKRNPTLEWTSAQIQNFKLNWPHLRNFDDSVLKHATLSELTSMERQKVSGSKILTQTLSRNFENIQNFPEKIPEGLDNCLGRAHQSRFLRGYARDAQELWLQGREAWGANGIEPMANYEVVSMGLGDSLTHKVWAEIHKPSSRARGGGNVPKRQEKSKDGPSKFKKLPRWVCRRYNEGRCESKDDRHQAHWDPSYLLKHVCSKWLNEKKRYCLDTHLEQEHK